MGLFHLYYKKALRLLTDPPERPDMSKKRIACVGDSITFGTGVKDTRKTDAWTYVWQRSIDPSCQIINYGVPGSTLQREGDLPYYRAGFLRQMIKARPDVIILMLGTNDSKPHNWNEMRYKQEYVRLVRKLLALPWPHKLVLMTSPRPFPEKETGVIAFTVDEIPIRDVIRPFVKRVGKKYDLPVIDLYQLTEDHPEYFSDGVHPNLLGNRVFAGHISAAAEALL